MPDIKNLETLSTFWDRLVEGEEQTKRMTQSLEEMKKAILQDLLHLFNTKRYENSYEQSRDLREGFLTDDTQLAHSLLVYGLPDLCTLNPKSQADWDWLCAEMTKQIQMFEPRLKDIEVSRVDEGGHFNQLHFRISAKLNIEPTPVPITVETTLETNTWSFHAAF